MQQPSEPLENLIDQFSRFPGVGRKGATRMAYEVMSMPNEQAMELAKAIGQIQDRWMRFYTI